MPKQTLLCVRRSLKSFNQRSYWRNVWIS